jgi:FtsP/CotA-like multicopper oxidase with cupredoxin domain
MFRASKPSVIPKKLSPHITTVRCLYRYLILTLAALAMTGPAVAQVRTNDRLISDPPTAILNIIPSLATRTTAKTKVNQMLKPLDGEVAWSTDINMVSGQIFNPRTGAYDKVSLRAYQGAGVDPETPFVAPTFNLKPGDTFRLTLNNTLSGDDPSCVGVTDMNKPHCFNSTNMHTHGLWVSPTGNSDNVLLRINPGASFTYEYNLPADHPAGTFWYHPHLHGSTALQVSSGMAGALVIRGDRLPSDTRAGDVDTLLRNPDGSPMTERMLLFQQIPYACRDADGVIKTDADGFWICEDGDVGTVEAYDQFGPPIWRKSGRYTSINGHVLPTFSGGVAGKIERWRMVHAGVRDSIKPSLRKFNPSSDAGAPTLTARTPAEQAQFVEANCNGAPVEPFSLATDGLTRDRLVPQDVSLLHPGYREDLLVVFPEPGLYCIIDEEAPANEVANQQLKSRALLGFVKIDPGTGTGGLVPAEYLRDQLTAAALAFMPAEQKQRVADDLANDLGLAAFQPHATLMTTLPASKQGLGFIIQGSPTGTVFQVGNLDASGGLEDPQSYAHDRIDRELKLEQVEDWDLRSFAGGHPFHIHVNPFQVVEVLDNDGNDVSGYEPGNTSPYARLKGAWKDTLFVTEQTVGEDSVPYRIKVRTKYQRYIGEFVLHCHILDHEDQGMMQNVRISLPETIAHN